MSQQAMITKSDAKTSTHEIQRKKYKDPTPTEKLWNEITDQKQVSDKHHHNNWFICINIPPL